VVQNQETICKVAARDSGKTSVFRLARLHGLAAVADVLLISWGWIMHAAFALFGTM
jgi:hypothetical protein